MVVVMVVVVLSCGVVVVIVFVVVVVVVLVALWIAVVCKAGWCCLGVPCARGGGGWDSCGRTLALSLGELVLLLWSGGCAPCRTYGHIIRL